MDNNDKYTTDQYQTFLQKKKAKKPSTIDDEILARASKIEQQTYSTARQANQTLQQSAQKQKQTSEHLRAQGEKLKNVKGSAKEVNVNVKESHHLTKEIKEEGKIFRIPFMHKIKNFLTRDKKVKEHSSDDQDVKREREVMMSGSDEEMDDTDKELKEMLGTLQGMRRETQGQKKEIRRQKGNIDDIAAYNQNTEYYMDKANKEMKDL